MTDHRTKAYFVFCVGGLRLVKNELEKILMFFFHFNRKYNIQWLLKLQSHIEYYFYYYSSSVFPLSLL